MSVIEDRLPAFAKLDRLTDRRRETACWPWLGYTQPNGYGWVNVDGIKIAAHRLALIRANGGDKPGLDACHTCDNRRCVNPAHLYFGTRRQNMADCSARERHNKPRGQSHWRAKLTDDSVRAIRQRYAAGETQASIARSFQINAATVSRIARGVWRTEVQ